MRRIGGVVLGLAAVAASAVAWACRGSDIVGSNPFNGPDDPALVSQGQRIFRFDTFGNETYWTDTLHMNQVVEQVDPTTALAVGLKVDADALPPGILATADLKSPATTAALLKLNAVVGVKATVDGSGHITRFGITCALCHSTVDNSVAPGIGHRLDGWPNHALNVGAIVALSPSVPQSLKDVLNTWGPGKYDARINFDGINGPVVIPPAYGLANVALETYTGEGPISYWNAYVAVTQMHGHGSFKDDRLHLNIVANPDSVTPKLPALRSYQHSIGKPAIPASLFDLAAAARGKAIFEGVAKCSVCHAGVTYTDDALHLPSETGMDPLWANRGTTKRYRTTPLRGLVFHAPYFHDGSASTLDAVVEHYNGFLKLGLTGQQKADLVQYLRSL
ncbi:MAG TPA: hypothetical protein VF832_06485 [Longimicrobiales bacterium]